MKCYYCEEEARAVCTNCGAFVCKNHSIRPTAGKIKCNSCRAPTQP